MRLGVIVRWIKSNPIYAFIGVIGTVTGAVAAVPPAWDAVSAAAGVPKCVTYSNIYYYFAGHFKNTGQQWQEFGQTGHFTFNEMDRNRDYITLINITPRTDPRWASMLVRLPVCGGASQWTYENPQAWVDLYEVTRTISPEQAPAQARFEATGG